MSDNNLTPVDVLIPSPEQTPETVAQNPELSQEAQHLDISDKQNQVVPELAFRQLLPVFFKHLTLLSRSEAKNALAHAIAFPFENESLPKLRGANTKVVFQTATRLFDAKLLMMYTYMRQAETNSLETIDSEIKVLQDKRAELVKNEETKTEETSNVS